MQLLEYVEIDIDFCANVYGQAPCTAALSAANPAKCFNTLKTCQDRENFVNSPVTLRFAKPTSYLPTTIDAIPSIRDVSFTPAVLNPGVDFGQRATVAVTFRDHPHPDTGEGYDKYVTERGYDPFERGTFFGKFRSRQPYLRGRPFRWIRGQVGDALADMETRHYVIDSFSGPSPDGTYTLVAKDVLKLADDDRTKAPLATDGTLSATLSAVATSFNLAPSGIGDLQYAASGHISIAGKEVCSFTRIADAMTIVRARFNTTAAAFAAGDRVQQCLVYTSDDAADILYDLLVTYAGVDPSYINLTAWQLETATYLDQVYTAIIVEPTGVNTLGSELIRQAALNTWWNDIERTLQLQVLRQIPADADTYSENNVLQSTLQIREQPEKRVSEVWVYFGLRNPCEPVDRVDNYSSRLVRVDAQASSDYGSAAIMEIFSRWIPQFGEAIASRLAAKQLGRYKDPPRLFTFGLLRGTATPALGGGYQISSIWLQDETGLAVNVPAQIVQLDPGSDVLAVQAEEALFTQYDDSFLLDRTITIDTNTLDFNLRSVHDSLFPEVTSADLGSPGLQITCIVAAGAIVGASTTSARAFDVGDWPVLPPIAIVVQGRIEGCGGAGGNAAITPAVPSAGGVGGIALYTRVAIQLNDSAGEIWSGGGGGGAEKTASASLPAGGGGGGAGQLPGAGGAGVTPSGVHGTLDGIAGTTEAGGNGGSINAGDGGAPGVAGGNAVSAGGSSGGAAGSAIDGVSHITTIGGAGDRRGGQVN